MALNTRDECHFQQVIDALHSDEVICYPTEGVWGLGCHPRSPKAFERLLAIKHRALDKGVILLAGNMAQMCDFADIDDDLAEAINARSGEFVTCVLPKNNNCPDYLSGQFNTVAMRLTQYAPLQQLCLAAQTAIVSTSANISGRAPVTSVKEAETTFGDSVSVYWDMPLGGQNKASRIIQWSQGKWVTLRD